MILGSLLVALLHYVVAWLIPQGADGSLVVERWKATHEGLAQITSVIGAHRALFSPIFLAVAFVLGVLLCAQSFAETAKAQQRVREDAAAWNSWMRPVAFLLLGLVFFSAGVSALTRYQGALALSAGRTIVDSLSAYDGLVTGIRFDGAFSGARLRLEDPLLTTPDIPASGTFTIRGSDRTTTMPLSEGESLRSGAVELRCDAFADSAMLVLEREDGSMLGRVSVLFEPASANESTVPPVVADLSENLRVLVRTAVDDSGGSAEGVSISVAAQDGTLGEPAVLGVGQSVALPDGTWLRLISRARVAHVTLSYDGLEPYRSAASMLALLATITSILPLRRANGLVRRTTRAVSRRDVDALPVSAVPAVAHTSTAGPAERHASWMLPLAAVAATAFLVLASGLVGPRARAFSDGQAVYTVSSAAEAYQALHNAEVHGRILVLLDDDAGIVERVRMAQFMAALDGPLAEAPVTEHNLTSALVYSGIARSVYYLPAPSVRDAETQKYAARSDALAETTGSRVRFYGADVHLTDGVALEFREPVVVYIAADVQEQYDPALVARLTDPDFADVVVREVTP